MLLNFNFASYLYDMPMRQDTTHSVSVPKLCMLATNSKALIDELERRSRMRTREK